jgi:hypothetical protein
MNAMNHSAVIIVVNMEYTSIISQNLTTSKMSDEHYDCKTMKMFGHKVSLAQQIMCSVHGPAEPAN